MSEVLPLKTIGLEACAVLDGPECLGDARGCPPPIAFPGPAERRQRRADVRVRDAHRPLLSDDELRLLAELRQLSDRQRECLWPWFRKCEESRKAEPTQGHVQEENEGERMHREYDRKQRERFEAAREYGPTAATALADIAMHYEPKLTAKKLARLRASGIVTLGDYAARSDHELKCIPFVSVWYEMGRWLTAAGLTLADDTAAVERIRREHHPTAEFPLSRLAEMRLITPKTLDGLRGRGITTLGDVTKHSQVSFYRWGFGRLAAFWLEAAGLDFGQESNARNAQRVRKPAESVSPNSAEQKPIDTRVSS